MANERKKQINLDAIIKVENFLLALKKKIENNEIFSADQLAREFKISRSTATIAIRLKIIKKGEIKGEYYLGESFSADRITAKKIIEYRRLKDIESKENQIREDIGEHKNEDQKAILDLLKKSANVNRPNLFSDQEKEFDDKLKLACAVASGMLSNPYFDGLYEDILADHVVNKTNAIYNKLK